MEQRQLIPKRALIGVREAAAMVGRHPETIRRWVWSGRLAARRSGHRLMMARSEVEALARRDGAPRTLREWAEQVSVEHSRVRGVTARHSASDLVIEDRRQRSASSTSRARR